MAIATELVAGIELGGTKAIALRARGILVNTTDGEHRSKWHCDRNCSDVMRGFTTAP